MDWSKAVIVKLALLMMTLFVPPVLVYGLLALTVPGAVPFAAAVVLKT